MPDRPALDRVPVEVPLLRLLFDAVGVGVWATDADGAVTAASPQASRLLGYPEQALLGRSLHELVHRLPDGGELPAAECPILGVLRDGRPAEGAGQVFRRSDGSLITVNWGAAPTMFAGELTGSMVAFYDSTREERDRDDTRRELAAARLAGERLTLLADAGSLLAEELGMEERLRRLAQLVVPALGDWSVVDLFVPPATLRRVAVAHREPDRVVGLTLPADLPPPDAGSAAILARALLGRTVVVINDVAALPLSGDALAGAEQRLFGRLGAGSALVAPLLVRGRVLGALTVVRWAQQAFGAEEVRLVEDLARRAALSVDNARAYALQRHAAETLQRSLLSDPPQVAGVRMAARYLPAVVETRLGGDWYDAFPLADGRLALVIGDVAGHDIPAAAAMAQVRTLLRAHAIGGEPPHLVLERLDETVRSFAVSELVTVVYALLTPSGAEWRLTWSNAGHPPPLVIYPDATVHFLETPVDLPIGVEAGTRQHGGLTVSAGSTLLLYTDGLVERRDRPIGIGLAELGRLAGGAARDVDVLVDALLGELADQPEDDVAVLAVALQAPPHGHPGLPTGGGPVSQAG